MYIELLGGFKSHAMKAYWLYIIIIIIVPSDWAAGHETKARVNRRGQGILLLEEKSGITELTQGHVRTTVRNGLNGLVTFSL